MTPEIKPKVSIKNIINDSLLTILMNNINSGWCCLNQKFEVTLLNQ
jgi:hypothetical protein